MIKGFMKAFFLKFKGSYSLHSLSCVVVFIGLEPVKEKGSLRLFTRPRLILQNNRVWIGSPLRHENLSFARPLK